MQFHAGLPSPYLKTMDVEEAAPFVVNNFYKFILGDFTDYVKKNMDLLSGAVSLRRMKGGGKLTGSPMLANSLTEIVQKAPRAISRIEDVPDIERFLESRIGEYLYDAIVDLWDFNENLATDLTVELEYLTGLVEGY